MNNNKIEKYIYNFLVKLDYKGYLGGSECLENKFGLKEDYVAFIISECVKSGYIDGISTQSNAYNSRRVNVSGNIYITREGYNFINQYRLAKINLFWIPFKNLVIIVITAVITAVATSLFKN